MTDVNEVAHEAPEAPAQESIAENPLEDIFPDRHPLSSMGDAEPEITEPPAVEVAQKVEPEPETTSEPEKVETPAPKDPVADAGIMAALMAERQKRQDLEKQIAAQNHQPQEFNWDKPEETIANIKQELKAEMQTNLLNMSEANAQSRYADYEEKKAVFMEMAQENPAVISAMLQQADPAGYAYDLAKQRMFQNEVGNDPQAYEGKLRAKIRAELEAEMKQKTDSRQALSSSLPPSAASMTNKNTPVDTVINNPLDDLFPGQHPS